MMFNCYVDVGRNVYRVMLAGFSKDVEIDFVFEGLVRLLNTVHQASHTYLPNSFRQVDYYDLRSD